MMYNTPREAYCSCCTLRFCIASIDTAESAVADNVSISRLLEFERVLALAGDRSFCFESGDLKVNVFPASKASSPPGAKGS